MMDDGNALPPAQELLQGYDPHFRGIPARWLKISLHARFPRVFRAVFIKALLTAKLKIPSAEIASDW